MAERWFLMERGRVTGHHTLAELRALADHGKLTRFHQVSKDQRQWEGATNVLAARLESGTARGELVPSAPASLAVAAPTNGPFAAVPPPPPDPTPPPADMPDDVLIPFPVSILLLLHYLTAGLFGFFWIVTMHGRLPRVRPNDLGGGLAAALVFVPVFNLYWIFHVTERLCERLNELRRYHGLTGQISEAFAVIIALLLTLPVVCWSVALVLRFALSDFNNAYLALVVVPAGLTVLVVFTIFPAFAAIAQGSFNEIGRLQITQLREQVRSMNVLAV